MDSCWNRYAFSFSSPVILVMRFPISSTSWLGSASGPLQLCDFLIGESQVYWIEVCGSTHTAGIPDQTRTHGYGSSTGRCLTGRVRYGYEVHGYGYTRFYPLKNTIIHDVGAMLYRMFFFKISSLSKILLTTKVKTLLQCDYNRIVTYIYLNQATRPIGT